MSDPLSPAAPASGFVIGVRSGVRRETFELSDGGAKAQPSEALVATAAVSAGAAWRASARWRLSLLFEPGVEFPATDAPATEGWERRGVVLPVLVGAGRMIGHRWGVGMDMGYAFAWGTLSGSYTPSTVPPHLTPDRESFTGYQAHRFVARVAAHRQGPAASFAVGVEGLLGTQTTESEGPAMTYTARQRGLSTGVGFFAALLFGPGAAGAVAPAGRGAPDVVTGGRKDDGGGTAPLVLGQDTVGDPVDVDARWFAQELTNAEHERRHKDIRQLLDDLGANLFKVREAAVRRLTSIGKHAVPYLITALQDKEWRRRANAAQALGLLGPVAIDAQLALATALSDKRWEVRYNAAYALAAIGAYLPDAMRTLRQAAVTDLEPKVRAAAKEALGKLLAAEEEAGRTPQEEE